MERSPKKRKAPKPLETVEVTDFRSGDHLRKFNEGIPARVGAMAHLGLTIAQIAFGMGVAEDTINLWLRERPGVREAFDKGKWMHDHGVALTLQQRALGYDYTETKTVTGVDAVGRPYSSTTTTTEHVLGDVTAQIFFLKNRDPSHWQDVHRDTNTTNILNVDMSKNMNLEILSEEEQKLIRSASIKAIANMNGIEKE